MFFELRVYPLVSGKGDEFAKYMDEEIIPYQLSKGMVILGSFLNDAKDTYVWIRRFDNEADKEARYDAVYNNDYWRDEIAPEAARTNGCRWSSSHDPRGDAALVHAVAACFREYRAAVELYPALSKIWM